MKRPDNRKKNADEPIYREFRKLKKHRKGQGSRAKEEQSVVYENIRKTEKGWKHSAARYTERMAEELRLPPDIVKGNPLVHLLGSNRVVVENYKKLIDYQEECIRILTGIGSLHIQGEHLRIVFYTKDEIKIVGRINGVEVKT